MRKSVVLRPMVLPPQSMRPRLPEIISFSVRRSPLNICLFGFWLTGVALFLASLVLPAPVGGIVSVASDVFTLPAGVAFAVMGLVTLLRRGDGDIAVRVSLFRMGMRTGVDPYLKRNADRLKAYHEATENLAKEGLARVQGAADLAGVKRAGARAQEAIVMSHSLAMLAFVVEEPESFPARLSALVWERGVMDPEEANRLLGASSQGTSALSEGVL